MNLNVSKVKNVCKLINLNPNLIFDNGKICHLYNSIYADKLENNRATTILSRLFRKGVLLRTKTQLKDGYCYSLNNSKELNRLYDTHLLPYALIIGKKLLTL